MNRDEHILQLISKALSDTSFRLSNLTQLAARIARLRNDFLNLWWLEWEMVNITDEQRRSEILVEIVPHLTTEQCEYFREKYTTAWIVERTDVFYSTDLKVDGERNVLAKGVAEIENQIEYFTQLVSNSQSPEGLHSLDLYYTEQSNQTTRIYGLKMTHSCKNVLNRIRKRVNTFLSQTEKQVLFGKIHSDIFEQNRQYVDMALADRCPDALSKFVAAYRRMGDDDPESWSQALVSCRRLLKSLADELYPPTDEPVEGLDGKRRDLGEEKYISRLWQFVYEGTAASTSGSLLQTQVEDLGNRIDRLYKLANKGVHAEVSRFEVNQCVIQTYLLAGDLLRIADGESAINEQS